MSTPPTAPTQGAAQPDLTDEEIAHTERWLSPPPNTAIAIDVASRIARLLAEVKRRRALVPPAAEPLAPPAAPAGQQPTPRKLCPDCDEPLDSLSPMRCMSDLLHRQVIPIEQEQLGRKEGA